MPFTERMPTGAESVAGIVALIIATVLADAIRPKGKLHAAIDRALRKRQTATDAHDAIPRIEKKVDRTYGKVESIEAKTDRNAYLIGEFHGDEDVTVSVNDLIDDDEDFYRGGDG